MLFIICYKYVKQKLYKLKNKIMKRNKGYYWVKREDEWFIGYYDGYCYWQRVGSDRQYTDFDWQEINEVEIKR